jgi:hypothetical protein
MAELQGEETVVKEGYHLGKKISNEPYCWH